MTVKRIATSALAAVIFVAGTAVAQQSTPPKVNCEAKNAKEKVEGQVLKLDAATDIITVKEDDGTTHEFRASKETLQDLKPGDRIEARLRPAQNC